ncbi:heterokaryon incompatibility protein-domain-containing protein [Hypoxylon rubiginosum]|uniref:Heterokaryon incompatibility protein-domain-containing protein n=1 Tax=Hypoxylon rubiginosum TaxID=110542 RepID=A0ACB9YS97_9PEZI|nr:heterokaryon incompatibility protein-domain-containing protein [Hypoxylon rubiginosum]
MDGQPGRIMIGDRAFHLVPADNEGQGVQGQSQLQRFDDPDLTKVSEFKYNRLPNTKKRIRLLRLKPAASNISQINCELIDADYDNEYHIPTRRREDRKKPEEKTSQSGPEQEPDSEKKKNPSAQYDIILENQIKYEALSWCWGEEEEEFAIIIEQNDQPYKRRIKRDLALALKYLRKTNESRTVWIDSICINQKDDNERNHQVQMMSRIYTRAEQVCIWLGEGTEESNVAIRFIKQEVMELNNFDSICSDKKYAHKWQALMMLMQRPWFSRRWMVQEISLARKAKIYCGPDKISWDDFAVAVELFVEVETATHRLSEVMRKDEKFRHIPGWFEHVSELGASLLVQATGKVFRTKRSDDHTAKDPKTPTISKSGGEVHTIDPLERRSLLSLQFLVTSMFIFQTSEPRDVIYSLLAVARDALPFVENSASMDELFMRTNITVFLEEKPFRVDYGRPYSDVCRDFVEFSIQRSCELDSVQALDILCRPWALEPRKSQSIRLQKESASIKERPPSKTSGWKTKDPSDPEKVVDDQRTTKEYFKAAIQIWNQWESEPNQEWKDSGWKPEDCHWQKHFQGFKRFEKVPKLDQILSGSPRKQTLIINTNKNAEDRSDTAAELDVPLPCWMPLASFAPFGLFHHPGMNIQKTGRVNADPLVGVPEDGHRNYNAAQTRRPDLKTLKFRKRPHCGLHGRYSLYVRGFIFDEVAEVADASQNGSIPASWLQLGGWEEPHKYEPPDEFWRTLVADRGKDNRNPPYYYARACRESVAKGGLLGGGINTIALINDERNSIIAEFCRRVQAVVWNRRLFKTKEGILGLASGKVSIGDKIGIIYGCTVPVILKEGAEKTDDELRMEEFDDAAESLKSAVKRCEEKRIRRLRFRASDISEKDREYIESGTKYVNAKLERLRENDSIKHKVEVNDKSTGGGRGEKGEKREKEEDEEKGEDGEKGEDEAGKNKEKAKERDSRRYYQLIGESYVHGMMDGDALRKKFYEEIADQTLELT